MNAMPAIAPSLDATDRHLLDEFQQDLPVCERPWAWMAERLGIGEDEVIRRLRRLQDAGLVSRVGPVFRPNRIGVSTLVALRVPEQRLDEVAAWISALPEVNHNYEREHDFNLWFVVTADDSEHLCSVLARIQRHTRLELLELPMLEDYFIDLGFRLQWT